MRCRALLYPFTLSCGEVKVGHMCPDGGEPDAANIDIFWYIIVYYSCREQKHWIIHSEKQWHLWQCHPNQALPFAERNPSR